MLPQNSNNFIDDDELDKKKQAEQRDDDTGFFNEDTSTGIKEETTTELQNLEVDLPKPGFGNAGKARTAQNAEEQIQEALDASEDHYGFPAEGENENELDSSGEEEANDNILPI